MDNILHVHSFPNEIVDSLFTVKCDTFAQEYAPKIFGCFTSNLFNIKVSYINISILHDVLESCTHENNHKLINSMQS